jgi:hypothetical protein
MVGGELATVRRFERPLMMTGAASGGALAPWSTLDAVVGAGDPLQVVAWCGSLWSGRATAAGGKLGFWLSSSKLWHGAHLYIGVFGR